MGTSLMHTPFCAKCSSPIIYTPVYLGELCGDCWREVSQKLEWDRSINYAGECSSVTDTSYTEMVT